MIQRGNHLPSAFFVKEIGAGTQKIGTGTKLRQLILKI